MERALAHGDEPGVSSQNATREISAIVDDARPRRPQQCILHPGRDAVEPPREDGELDAVDPAGPSALVPH
jgi:hypothetical protein